MGTTTDTRKQDVRWFRSLGGKLFLLVAVCLLVAVATVSLRNVSGFTRYLEVRLQDNAQQDVRKVASSIGNALDNWSAQTAAVLHQAFVARAGELNGLLRGLVASNTDILNAEVYQGKKLIGRAATEDLKDVRFEDRDAAPALKEIGAANARWVAEIAPQIKGDVAVHVLTAKVGLPVINLCRRFATPGGGSVWAIVSLWQTPLIGALPQSETAYSMVVEGAGRILLFNASADQQEELTPVAARFASIVRKLDLPYGASHFVDLVGVPRIGAYTQLKRYGLTTIVSSDARPGLVAIKGMVLDTVKWSWVIMLFALMASYLAVSTVTRKLKAATEATRRIADGDFSAEIDARGGDEVAVLSRSVNHMAQQIQGLLKSKVEAARQEKELETARIVQETLFPKGDLDAPAIRAVGRTRVASECGGDWWGHFETDDGLHCVMIADVTGHGAAAALVTALAYASVKTFAETYRDPKVHNHSVTPILMSMNRLLWNTGHGKTTMTALVMLVDPRSGEVVCASAGHCMPYLVQGSDGSVVPVMAKGEGESSSGADLKRFKVLKVRGAILGMEPSPEFKELRFNLNPGDKVLAYTDGLTECVDASGVRWGKRSMEKILNGKHAEGAGAFCEAVVSDAFRHFGGHPVDDDVTVLVVERVNDAAAIRKPLPAIPAA